MSKTQTRLTSRVKRRGHTSFQKKITKSNRIGGANTAEDSSLNSEKYNVREKSKDSATVNGMKMSNLNTSKRGTSNYTQNMPIKRGALWPYQQLASHRKNCDGSKKTIDDQLSEQGRIDQITNT